MQLLNFSIDIVIAITMLFIGIISLFIAQRKKFSLRKRLIAGFIHLPLFLGLAAYFEYISKCLTLGCYVKIGISALLFYISLVFILTFLVLPKLYKFVTNAREIKEGWMKEFITKQSKKLGIKKPQLYLTDNAKPIAASCSNMKAEVFISVGLLELLNRKEIKAILLHELGHIKYRSSLLKLSTFMLRIISPLARFTLSQYDPIYEEKKADEIVERVQKTRKYLESAKGKINSIYRN